MRKSQRAFVGVIANLDIMLTACKKKYVCETADSAASFRRFVFLRSEWSVVEIPYRNQHITLYWGDIC